MEAVKVVIFMALTVILITVENLELKALLIGWKNHRVNCLIHHLIKKVSNNEGIRICM